MLPRERQEKIKEFIQAEENMRIADLSQLLGVSEMTIHRDIKPMIQEGWIIKTFGGISLAPEPKEHSNVNGSACVFCSRHIQGNLTYRLILENNAIELACCAHCGLLRHRQHGKRVMQALCTDFFKQTTISAVNAWYVMDATVDIGCCYPQVLTFAQKEIADKFVYGFAGCVYSFQEATGAIFQKMNGDPTHCSHHEGQDKM